MGLKLNDTPDWLVEENLPHEVRRMAKVEQKLATIDSSTPEQRLKLWSIYGEQLLGIAFSEYQLERAPDQIADKLARSAGALTNFLELPEAVDERPWKLVEYLSWAVAFGTPATRERLGRLPPYPVRDEADAHQVYLRTMIAFLRGEPIADALEALVERTSDRKAARHYASVVLPCAKALGAVVDRDAAALDAALGDLLKHHQREVRGELRTDHKHGYMIAHGLPYIRLALENDIPLSIDSVYLPTWLVELSCRTTSST